MSSFLRNVEREKNMSVKSLRAHPHSTESGCDTFLFCTSKHTTANRVVHFLTWGVLVSFLVCVVCQAMLSTTTTTIEPNINQHEHTSDNSLMITTNHHDNDCSFCKEVTDGVVYAFETFSVVDNTLLD